jgi:ligand-binding sensor domain-containing protein
MWNQLPVAGSAILAGVLMWAEAVLAVPQETVTEVKDIQAEYFHRAWNREDGLPDNVVNAILQTRDGYLWLATPSGLARFDGLHFTVFNLENSPDMGSDHCWSLAEDNSGTLWILTNTGLLARTEAGFRQFHASRESPGWRPLLAAGRGGIWTAIPPKPNLDHLDSNGGLASYRLPRVWEWISSVAELNDGSFWVGEVHGAFWIDPHLKEAQAVGSFATEGGPYTHTTVFLPDGTGYDLLERSNFHDAQLYRIEKYGGERCGTNVISNVGRRLFLAPDRQGNLWMPSAETGLLRYAGQRFTQFIIPRGLDNDLVLCMYESHDGLLWFGSGHSGLHRLQPRCVRTITASDGLAGETAECLLESRDGSLWVGTENGLSRFTQGRCTNFYQKDGLARKIVRSLAEDQEGVIWIGTLGGLNRMKDNQLLPYRFPGLWEEGKIRALLAPKAGGLWVGTVRGLHWLYQGRGAKFTTAQGLSTNEVLSLLEDRSGDLWVGTPGGGLNRLHWQDGFGRSLSPESPDPLASISNVTVTVVSTTNGLSCNIIRSLYQDTNGVLWIGTDQGLNRYENGRCTVYRVEQGLVENQVDCG